jgi:hypothetical protein
LPCYADGFLAFFDKSRLIDDQDACRHAYRLSHELMIVPLRLLLMSVHITDEPRQPRIVLPSTWRAIGSMDFRASELN